MTGPLFWHDHMAGKQRVDVDHFGDVILGRKEMPTSYHLAVTVDDAAQDVTDVSRGIDLFTASHVHRLLQALLDLPVPRYHHHRLLTDASGRRFAKRDQSLTLAHLRAAGHSPADIRRLIAGCRVGA
jgi:glutamyl-Q tRNA(Asp) synthetase